MATATVSPKVRLSPSMSVSQVLSLFAAGQITADEYTRWDDERLARLAKSASARSPEPLRCKLSVKGAVSLYGLNARFPVTLSASQWERVIEYVDSLKAFIKANEKALARK